MISKTFRAAVKLAETPAYRIAQRADMSPCELSKIICGIEQVKPGDPRVERVANILGLKPEDCFADE